MRALPPQLVDYLAVLLVEVVKPFGLTPVIGLVFPGLTYNERSVTLLKNCPVAPVSTLVNA